MLDTARATCKRYSRRSWVKAVILILLGMLFSVYVVMRGSTWAQNYPGSEEDPLVTRSYVERHARMRLLEVPANSVLRPATGTELVLRAGRGDVKSGPGGGLADLTRGLELGAGDRVPENHLLLNPRDDGRGIVTRAESIFLIRGDYMLEKPGG